MCNYGPWRYDFERKALAFARVVAGAVGETYEIAVENGKRGRSPASPHADLPDAERVAYEAEDRYNEGRRWP